MKIKINEQHNDIIIVLTIDIMLPVSLKTISST